MTQLKNILKNFFFYIVEINNIRLAIVERSLEASIFDTINAFL